MRVFRWTVMVGAASCAAGVSQLSVQQQRDAANEAVVALKDARFETAGERADQVLLEDPYNAWARAVRALTRYKRVGHDLSVDARAIAGGALLLGGALPTRYVQYALREAEAGLAAVADDLSVAARQPSFAMELCMACWPVDWNYNGEIDDGDRWLLEVERDAHGEKIPYDDPRRRPTFRFDVGDIHWAQAMVAFARAALTVVSAYKFDNINFMEMFDGGGPQKPTVRIPLVDPTRIAAARRLVLDGLAFADASRVAYLAETDDVAEWVPNPTQRNHPMPLPVDAALYDTWAAVLADLGRLIRSEEGIDVAELAQLGDRQWENPPQGYIDIGGLFERPGDLVIDLEKADRFGDTRQRATVEAMLRDMFGDKYRPQMKASPLMKRFERMAGEIQRGEESFERKLRYLIWLN